MSLRDPEAELDGGRENTPYLQYSMENLDHDHDMG